MRYPMAPIRWHLARLLGALGCVLLPWAAGAGLISSFQAGTGDWQLGTLTVGNVDGGTDLEIIIPHRNTSGQWFLDGFKWNGTRLPGFPWSDLNNDVINTSPTLYDLDGDGQDEIIFTCGANVIAMKGNGSILWSSSVNSLNYIPDGGYQVVTNGFYWYPTYLWLNNLPPTAAFYSEVSPPIVADVAGNGTPEVLTAWKINPDTLGTGQDFNPFISPIWGGAPWGTQGEDWSGGVVFHNATNGAQDFVYHIHQLVESGLALGHADTKPPWEIYVLNDSDSVVSFDKTQPNGLWGRGMLHGKFGKNQQLISGAYEQGVDIYTADVDGDGLAEVLVPMTQFTPFHQPGNTILDDDGSIMWRQWNEPVSFTNNHGWLNSACMIPVNPDHDNHIDVITFSHSYEISYQYWDGVNLVNHPGWPKSFYPRLPTPPVVGDVDGDGQQEIVIGTYDPTATPSTGSLYIYALDGTLKQSLSVPGGIKQIPSLAAVKGDGALDVIYRSTLGMVYIQNFGATTDTNVSWATHRGNARHDGNYNVSLFPPGTPLIMSKQSGYHKTTFSWGGTATNTAGAYRIYRADRAAGIFTNIVTLAAGTTSYTDTGLAPGWLYFYEVAAIYGTNEVCSSPFVILSLMNSNLIANGGFEENDNSHWDKWYSGDIDWTNMIGNTNIAYQGRQSMEIQLLNKGNESSISQFNQYGIPDSVIPVTTGGLYSLGGFFYTTGISRPSEHWLEWGSTRTSTDTNARPGLPFPYYFTPHFVIGTNAAGWAYGNRTFIMPAGFPNVELRHRYSITAPGSGSMFLDNIFLRPLPASGDPRWVEVLPFGSTWRYATTTPPTNWYATTFNDTSWHQGKAKLGNGSGPTNLATLMPQFQPAYYFRHGFVLADTNLEELLLSATCTDNNSGPSLQMWLNGRQIPATDIDPVSDQGNQILYYDLTPFIGDLQPGTNVMAVILNNAFQSWDDVAFDLDLKAMPGPAEAAKPAIVSIQRGSASVTLGVQTPVNTIWNLESADQLGAAWRLVTTFTNFSTNVFLVSDAGQNGRVPPRDTATRFYRLAPY